MKAWREKGAWCFKVHGSQFQPAGIPDIVGVFKGRFVACETKMPGNEPSRIQQHRIKQIEAAGGRCVVAYSVEEATRLLEDIENNG